MTLSHLYADDVISGTPSDVNTISVTVVDDDTGSVSGTTPITINNVVPAITGTSIAPASINENGTATLTVSFTDAGVQDTFTATVTWGDGSAASTISVAANATINHSFTISHQYLDDNPTGTPSDVNTVSVKLVDDDTGSASSSTSLVVNNVAPAITGIAVSPTHIVETHAATLTVSFTDAGSQDTFTATVDWGDGGPTTTVALAAGANPHTFSLARRCRG